MFLKMITASKERIWNNPLATVAAKLLTIVSIADQEDNDNTQDMAPFEVGSDYYSDEIKEYFGKRPGGEWFISKKEQVILEEYLKELGIWKNEWFALMSTPQMLKEQGCVFTPSALKKAIEEFASITTHISLDDRRKIMIKHAVADAIDSVEESISVQLRKCILFECLAVASVDNDYSEMEQYAISCIVEKFNLDKLLVDEMVEYIEKYMSLYGEIYELITE